MQRKRLKKCTPVPGSKYWYPHCPQSSFYIWNASIRWGHYTHFFPLSVSNLVLYCGFIHTLDPVLLCWRLQGGDELPESESPCWFSPDPGYGPILFSIVQGIRLHVLYGKIHGKYICLAILGPNFHFVRTWQPASVSSTVCMGLWNTAAPCEWGTTLHTSKSALLRGKQNSTTRTCQVRVPRSSALFACSVCSGKLYSRGILSFEIFCQWGCIICSSFVFFLLNQLVQIYYNHYSWRKKTFLTCINLL